MALDIVKENQRSGCAVNLAGDGKYDSPGQLPTNYNILIQFIIY